MSSLYRPSYPDKKTGKPKRLKRWYGKYRDAAGVLRKVPLSPNKAAAQLMLNELVAKVERERAGLVDRTASTPSPPSPTTSPRGPRTSPPVRSPRSTSGRRPDG